MRKRYKIIISSIIFYLSYGLFLSQYELNIIPQVLEFENPKGFYDYSGIINIHSLESTGSGSIEGISHAAKQSGLDFIFITDLNSFSDNSAFEGYHEDVLVLMGNEYSYLDSNILYLNKKPELQFEGLGQFQVFLTDKLNERDNSSSGGMFILAHPFKKNYRWSGDYPPGLHGIEIVNLKSIWQRSWLEDKVSFLWTLFIYPFNPELALVRLFETPEKEVQLWDELSKKNFTIGVAGSDAEAKLKVITSPEVPSYETLFNIVRNHVLLKSELTGDFKSDKEKIMTAIKKGQFYFSLDKMANPKGFNAFVEAKDEIFPIGSKLPFKENLKLRVVLPAKPLYPFETVIIKDGNKIMSSNSQETSYTISEAGTYRVIVRVIPTFPLPDGKKWIPWILTNPIQIL